MCKDSFPEWQIRADEKLCHSATDCQIWKGTINKRRRRRNIFRREKNVKSIYILNHVKVRNDTEVIIKTNNKRIIEELSILIKLKENENIQTLIGYNLKHKMIITDWCQGGDLFEWFIRKQVISEHEIRVIIKQVVNAMLVCHRNGIAHLDIKLENIVLKNDIYNLKLIDFDSAININQISNKIKFKTTIPCTPPEIINNIEIKAEDLFAIDYWEIGVLMYLLLTTKYPFGSGDNTLVMYQIRTGRYNWPKNIDVTSEYVQFTNQLLEYDSSNRLNLDKEYQKYDWLT